MEIIQKDQILGKINSSQSILIAVSQNSGFDGLASGLAVYLSIKKFGRNAAIFALQPTVQDAHQLYGVDKIGKLEGKRDVLVIVSNAINTVDKVTYFLDKDKLKIKIHSLAGSNGVSNRDVVLKESTSDFDTIIAIGYSSGEELSNEIAREQNINSTAFSISIGVEQVSQKFAQVEIHDSQSASISEVATGLLRKLSMPFDEDIAFNLYTGIKAATNMFSPKIAKRSSFETVQYLLEMGAGRASLAGESHPGTTGQRRGNLTEESKGGDTPKYQETLPEIGSPKLSTYGLSQLLSNREVTQKVKQDTKPDLQGSPPYDNKGQASIEEVETKEDSGKESWLKPPKIYRGSKSFDLES